MSTSRVSRQRRREIVGFLRKLTAQDFAGVRAPAPEVGRPLHPGKHAQVRAFTPPADYSLVEAVVDLRLAVVRRSWTEAVSLYYYLRRQLNY